MKKICKKSLVFMLVFGIITCIFSLIPITANAAGGVQAKLNSIKSVYPDSCKYFTRSGNACSNAGGDDCKLQNIPARGGLPSGASVSSWGCWSCYAFAEYVFAYTFGNSFRNCATNSAPVLGDVVKLNGWYGYDHYGIYLSEDSNCYYIFDGNGDGNCGVQYGHALSKSEHPLKQTYHAPNYDTINGPVSYNPQGYLDGADSPSPGKLHVAGWAFDRDDLSASLKIHIYVGGTYAGEISAWKGRADVNGSFPGVGDYHGFEETIDVSQSGSQNVDVYAINVGGGSNILLGSATVNIQADPEKPTISNLTVSQVTSKGYRVTCNVSDNVGVTKVRFPTWTKNNGQDDLIWHDATLNGNGAFLYINTSEHNNETGEYITHVYAYDAAGNSVNVSTGVINVSDEPIKIASNVYNGHKYTVYNSGKSWTEAKKWCEDNGGHLATITTSSEWDSVKGLLEKYNGVRCWLGAESTSGSWNWVTGEDFSFSNWADGQPDCSGGNEFFLGTWGAGILKNYKWNDFLDSPRVDDFLGGFVMETDIIPTSQGSFSGHKYEYFSDTMNWNQAFRFCEKRGGHLVTINSKEENDFVLGITNAESGSIWTGGKTGSSHEVWRWITGETFEYQNWSDGEPNNYNEKGQDAVRLYIKGDDIGKWDDCESTASESGFVCEYDNEIDASGYEPVYQESYNGHEYFFFDDYVSWQTAKKICEAKGGYLSIIEDYNENNVIKTSLQNISKDSLWLGASDIEEEGVWRDVKGNVLKYTNWHPVQPDNANDREDYLMMWPEGVWNDASFSLSETNGFVCEFDDHCSAFGHTYTETVVSPTSTSMGFTLHTCSACGYSYKDTYTGGKLVNKSVLSARTLHLGNTITINAKTEGGVAPYTYAYYYKLNSRNSWNKLSDGYVSDTSKILKLGTVGEYDIKIVAKDSSGNTAQRILKLVVDNPVLNNSKVSAKKVNKGEPVTLSAAAAGGTAPYSYSYYYKLSTKGTWNSISDGFVDEKTIALKLNKPGIYDLKIIVKDSQDQTAEKTFKLTIEDPVINNSSVSSESINKGDAVEINAAATGGTAPYTYAYYYKLSTKGTWNKLSDGYVSDESYVFKPGTPGTYDIKVIAKDNDGKTAEKTFKLIVENPVINNSTVSSEIINKGEAVTLKAAASGGTAPYTYSYLYKLSTKSSWNKLSDGFVTETSQVLKPGKAGIYDLKVIAKDSEGTTAEKTFRLTVEDPVLNRSSVNAEIIAEGGTIVITASATGGTAPYTYSYLYKLSTKGSWNKLSDGYVSDTSKSLKLGKAGEYDIKVIARDSAGAASEKTFTVEVI